MHKPLTVTVEVGPGGSTLVVAARPLDAPPEATAASDSSTSQKELSLRPRYRAEGLAGLKDRSSRPHRLHCPTPPEIVSRIEALRQMR